MWQRVYDRYPRVCQGVGDSIAKCVGSEEAEGACPSAGASGFINLIVSIYHEVHEVHEVFFNLTSLCVLRALRGDITLSL